MGVFFRFVNLDRKIYWMDETYTSLRISGYTESEVAQQLLQGEIISIQDLHKYQHINSKKSVVNTVKGLAVEEPQLPPLYFVLVRFWAQLFGDSVANVRSCSAFLSLLAFPCLYWLCLELFKSSLVGWLACALFAVSPFQLVYAQEARQYSLWAVAILLSSASLLRAMRVNNWRSWSLYAATVAIGLYSHLFFLLVAISHAIYVFVNNNYRFSKTLKAYLREHPIFAKTRVVGASSSLVSQAGKMPALQIYKNWMLPYLLSFLAVIIAFLPWIVVLFINYKQALIMTAAQDIKTPLLYFIKSWLGNLSRNFIDTGFSSSSPLAVPWSSLVFPSISVLAVLALVTYSLSFLGRHTPKKTWLFVFILIGFTSLAIIIPDLILGRRTSVTGRYMIPSYLGIQLAVSYLFGTQFNSLKKGSSTFWRLTLLALLTSGVISCMVISPAETWWNNLTDTNNRQLAQIINQPNNPLVVQEIASYPPRYNVFNLISLSYLLEPDVKFKFIPKNTVTKIPLEFSHVFFISPSHALKSGIEKEYRAKLEPIDKNQGSRLWRLVKP